MPTISAKVVLEPRRSWHCAMCRNGPLGPHLKLFGMGEAGDKPYEIRVCPGCAGTSMDPKVRAVLEELCP